MFDIFDFLPDANSFAYDHGNHHYSSFLDVNIDSSQISHHHAHHEFTSFLHPAERSHVVGALGTEMILKSPHVLTWNFRQESPHGDTDRQDLQILQAKSVSPPHYMYPQNTYLADSPQQASAMCHMKGVRHLVLECENKNRPANLPRACRRSGAGQRWVV